MWRGLLGCVLVLLGACGTMPSRPTGPVPRDAASVARLETWQATGRLAVRTAQDGFSAHFDWRQAPGDGELSVRGPFGAGAARILIGADRIRVESGTEPPLELAAPYDALEPVLSARIGFPLPLESLRYWLLGIPAPGVAAQAAGEGAFEQSGWHVAGLAFAPVAGSPEPLPGRVEMTRGTTRIRVLVDRWRTGPP